MRDDDPRYRAWLDKVPSAISSDLLWRLPAYRIGLYLASLAGRDAMSIARQPYARSLGDQLVRSVGSIAANIAEGYGRSSGRERARFYEYALGSAREAIEWYFLTQGMLPDAEVAHRLDALARVRRILSAVIPRERVRNRVPPRDSSRSGS